MSAPDASATPHTHDPEAGAKAVAALASRLATARGDAARAADFDMDDGPERTSLAPFPPLARALDSLAEVLLARWRAADTAAERLKRRHTVLANVAILCGALAVVLAVVQLGSAGHAPEATATRHDPIEAPPGGLSGVALIEVVVASLAALAVGVGLVAKFDRRWQLARWRAERLRSLKFRALGWKELWCPEPPGAEAQAPPPSSAFRARLRSELECIEGAERFHVVETWLETDPTQPEEPDFAACGADRATVAAALVYYREKRLAFQRDYFARRAARHPLPAEVGRALGLPLFFASILAAGAHVFAELYGQAQGVSNETREGLHAFGRWALAAAAGLPVVGFAFRAWIGAFETHRGAALHRAKARSAERAIAGLDATIRDATPQALAQIAAIEHLFETESREWLRLVKEAEWFL